MAHNLLEQAECELKAGQAGTICATHQASLGGIWPLASQDHLDASGALSCCDPGYLSLNSCLHQADDMNQDKSEPQDFAAELPAMWVTVHIFFHARDGRTCREQEACKDVEYMQAGFS